MNLHEHFFSLLLVSAGDNFMLKDGKKKILRRKKTHECWKAEMIQGGKQKKYQRERQVKKENKSRKIQK